MVRLTRDPRRAYDEHRQEIPPITVDSSRASGLHTVSVFCEVRGCHQDAIVSLHGWPDDMPVPDLALRLRCSECGGRQIKIMINEGELYAKAHGQGLSDRNVSTSLLWP
jgi:hypothetical protein